MHGRVFKTFSNTLQIVEIAAMDGFDYACDGKKKLSCYISLSIGRGSRDLMSLAIDVYLEKSSIKSRVSASLLLSTAAHLLTVFLLDNCGLNERER